MRVCYDLETMTVVLLISTMTGLGIVLELGQCKVQPLWSGDTTLPLSTEGTPFALDWQVHVHVFAVCTNPRLGRPRSIEATSMVHGQPKGGNFNGAQPAKRREKQNK